MNARRLFAALAIVAIATSTAIAQRITTPKEEFGHNYGDDYFLATYRQISAYWQKLERESDRIHVVEIGKTAEGRPHYMVIATSPENWRNIARYKEISRRMALAEGLTDAQARAMAKEGKAVVWIDGGLHATETLGAQQLGEMVYQLASRTDDETVRFLNDCVILLVHANPDGNDLVADWYMRNPAPEQRSMANLPRLYQKYIGHDNNREFFTSTQAETENINRVLYHEWFPQILYNHHQSGPAGTIVYSPPLRDPYNPNLDPMLILGLQSLGAAMHTRLALEEKPGATMRTGGPYDGWWNGGIRNTATFHNIIALLTEMIGSPTPMRVPFIAQRQVPSADLAYPVPPQEWRFRQSIDYSIAMNRGFVDFASRMRENLLYNIYTMGRHSIERGSTDTWTPNYRRVQAVGATIAGGRGGRGAGGAAAPGGGGRGGEASAETDMAAWAALRKPELRDPRGFIISANQPDVPTAVKFINSLRETGITVLRATADFTVAGKQYPKGSFVVKTDQSFRPHVIDMFEPQAHPDVFPYPGAPPTPPYDIAGWTYAYQAGIEFDRILDGFTGPFEKVNEWNVAPPAGKVATATGTSGFVLSGRTNNSFIAVNRLLKAGEEVSRTSAPVTVGTTAFPAGSFYVRAKGTTRALLDKAAVELGVSFEGTRTAPAGASRLKAPRIGLWDNYGGSMPSGWTRWIMEQFEYPFERVFAPQLDAGNLNAKYDVLVFVSGGIPGAGGGRGGRGGAGGAAPTDLPAEYRDQFGAMTVQNTLPKVREFIENGGTAIAIGSSAANLAAFLQLPIESQLAENGQPLPNTRFYIPGSVLRTKVDTNDPLGFGMSELTDVFFDESPAWRLGPNAAAAGVKKVAWYDSKAPLRSGWAWGQEVLDQGAAAVSAKVGKGNVLLFGPEILQRAQPHGTFKFLFNGILYSQTKGAILQ